MFYLINLHDPQLRDISNTLFSGKSTHGQNGIINNKQTSVGGPDLEQILVTTETSTTKLENASMRAESQNRMLQQYYVHVRLSHS